MSDYTQYPARQVIRRREFSVRHMILEELKHRLRIPGLSERDRARLAWVADGVMVQARAGGFIVTLYDVPVLEIEQSKLYLYVRGDTEAASGQQFEMGGAIDETHDPFLEKSRTTIIEGVDALLGSIGRVSKEMA
ncbi:MAG: hypothetical protein HY315_10520 [Acidobacteria bacterium]|nr:hypothetical protein [Acidobacteriota bacterium]